MLNRDLQNKRQRIIMVVAHDQDLAIGKDGELLKRHPSDMAWFRRITMGRVCIVGSNTYNEVADLSGRIWLRLTRSEPLEDLTLSVNSVPESIALARRIAIEKNMDCTTTVIAGGGQVYNAYMDLGMVDSIYATVWPDVLGGTTFINDYRKDPSWVLVEQWPLEDDDATYDMAGKPMPVVQHWVKKRI